MPENLCDLDATDLARLIAQKQVSPVEVMRAHLERIATVNSRINAILTLAPAAEGEARRAEAAVLRGETIGPLHGVPFTVKDSLDTAGVRTTRGSQLFADHVPATDATAVARLKRAGAVLLAKTNVPEFSFARETANLLVGRTVNPWNPERTPGGSSGGEAAAIAARLSPLGLGSDVAVSIRGPAHYCGIVGLKATHGRIPLTGHWPETLRRFWHVGPMARSVRDTALALTILAGPDGRDGYAMPFPPPVIHDGGTGSTGPRVGWLAKEGFGPVADEVADTVARAAEALASLGVEVEETRIPGLLMCDGNALTATLFRPEAGSYFADIVRGRAEALHPVMQRFLDTPVPTLGEYMAALRDLERLRDDIAAYFSHHDVLLCPVSPVAAFPHDARELVVGEVTLPARHVVRPTAPFNVTGSPALSVPFGWSKDGLPIGIQLVGRHGDEATLLRLGMALERFHDRRRPLLSSSERFGAGGPEPGSRS